MTLDVFGAQISVDKLIHSAIYILFVFVIYLILRRVLKIIFRRSENKKMSSQQRQKIQTVSQMIGSLLKYAMLILVILVILADFGVNVTSLIAGLGILTAVMGLAFQDMIKDIIAGVTIIVENQFSVGDIVELDGFKGTVISVGLKTTEIKNSNGQVKIIANHNIDGLINYSKFDATATVEVRTNYSVSSDKTMRALNEVKKHVARVMKLTSSDVVVVPVTDNLETKGVAYTMSCPCAAGDCFTVQSLMREAILDEFKKEKIDILQQEIVCYNINKGR